MNSWLRSQPGMIHTRVCFALTCLSTCSVCVCASTPAQLYCYKRMPIILKIRGEVGSCIVTAYMGVSCIVWRLPPLCVQNNRRQDRTTCRLAGDVACEWPYGLNHSAAPTTGFKHTHTHATLVSQECSSSSSFCQEGQSTVCAVARVACTTPWHLLQPRGRGLVKLSACYQVITFWSFAAELVGLLSDVEALAEVSSTDKGLLCASSDSDVLKPLTCCPFIHAAI